MKLRYSRGALADLEEIFSYIARNNPRAAARRRPWVGER